MGFKSRDSVCFCLASSPPTNTSIHSILCVWPLFKCWSVESLQSTPFPASARARLCPRYTGPSCHNHLHQRVSRKPSPDLEETGREDSRSPHYRDFTHDEKRSGKVFPPRCCRHSLSGWKHCLWSGTGAHLNFGLKSWCSPCDGSGLGSAAQRQQEHAWKI